MIDTIRLRVKKPVLLPGNRLNIVPPAQQNGGVNHDRFIEVLAPGKKVPKRVREVYLHEDYVDIHSFANYMMITFQVPQVLSLSMDNTAPASYADTVLVFEKLQVWLREVVGVDVDIWDCGVSRIDLFANATSRYSFDQYAPLFELLNLKRQNRSRYESTYYGQSVYRTTCIYEKGKFSGEYVQQVGWLRESLIRWEVRLRRARTVQRVFNIYTVADLLEKWDHLSAFYKASVRKALRMGDGLEYARPIPDLRAEIRQCATKPGDMEALWLWLWANGTRHVSHRFPQLGELKSVLRSLDYQPYQISRFLGKFAQVRSIRLVGEQVSINDLRNELYRGLIG